MLYTHGKPTVTLDELRTHYTVPTLDELQAVRKDATGTRWRPIHHADLVDEIIRGMEARGFGDVETTLALSEDRHDIFGTIQPRGLDIGRADMAPVLGFRSSNLQRFRLIGVTGARVFICSNGVIVGDFVFGCKHTSGNVDTLDVSIDDGLGLWHRQTAQLRAFADFAEGLQLHAADSDHLLMEAGRRGVLAWNQLGKVQETYHAYQEPAHPHHAAFAERNAWSLYNAVTEVGKGWRSPRVGERGLKGFPRIIADTHFFRELDALADPVDGPDSN